MVSVSRDRVEAVSGAVSSLGLPALLRLEEEYDPQYAALQRLADSVGRGAAAAYALLVASVSYRLTMRGEEWWSCVSDYLSSLPPPRDADQAASNVERFLVDCRGAAVGREAKISRLRRLASGARGLLSDLMRDPEIPLKDPRRVHDSVARAVGSGMERKTVAFAVKMAYYAARPRGSMAPLSYNLPMPVDVRVACVSVTSGVVTHVNTYRDLVRGPGPAQEAWSEVSRLSGVPTPHIDSLLWVVGWAPRDLGQADARRAIEDLVSRVAPRDAAARVARELTAFPCR